MATLKAIIVDDEQTAQETLSGLIAKYCKDITIAGIAGSVNAGIDMIRKTDPDIVFLDIEMSPGNGFELLEKIKDINFKVIFTTAYDQYALKAIKFSALDYILKPIDIDELVNAVKKARESGGDKVKLEVLKESVKPSIRKLKKVILPTLNGYSVEDISGIIRCEAESNYTNFIFKDKKITICKTLKEYDELFDGLGFFRIHQSYLVNIDHIKSYQKGGSPIITMSDGANIPIARNKKAEFLAFFFDNSLANNNNLKE